MRNKVLLLLLVLLSLTCISCKQDSASEEKQNDFVCINGNKFQLHGEDFFPNMLNYVVDYQKDGNNFVIAPNIDYDSLGIIEAKGEKAVAEQLRGHFQLIKEMGFNTLRVCMDRIKRDKHGYYFRTPERKFRVGNSADEAAIFKGLEQFVAIAQEKGLRLMLLIKSPVTDPSVEQFTVHLLDYFHNNPTIFAYDFFNEPLYFDPVEKRKKEDALSVVQKWKKLMTKHAPDQLFTIGFSEPIEVFEWDPSILPVDFVEVHTYHPLRIPNEVYWYSHYVNKPWMIGETALPADGDSISYEEQARFMVEAYKLTRDAGGAGFGWWMFQEPGAATNFEGIYTALINHEGTTTTADGKYTIHGKVKPAGLCLKELANYKPKSMKRPTNYFNMLGYKNICIRGKVLDMRTRKPIAGAVVRGWNEYWSVGMNTFTDENGCFTLYSNDECVHFCVSAPGASTIEFDKQLSYTSESGAAFNKETLPNRELEYQQIGYRQFLKTSNCEDESYSIFGFKESEFTQYTWSSDMGTILLVKEK